MLVRSLSECDEFVAGDGSLLRELLHPDKMDAEIRYSLAHARVAPAEATRPHRLAGSEVYYVIAGCGRMFIGEESQVVGAGCAVYIPPGATQFIENTGDDELVFLCIVDPAWREQDEELVAD
jgi:mannose-6-phosphate isomerase-like protein (cupin superfamily)